MASSFRIVVVGDIHEDWEFEHDYKALKSLQPELVLFTGDFGNENVELVRSVAKVDMPKAAILGNHHSWGTSKFSSKIKDGIQLQLEVYGVRNMEESAHKIHETAMETPSDHSIIFLAHNGPTGLGSSPDDICCKDWEDGGDYGDPDLAQAISLLKETSNYSIPLVVFGHMHKELLNGGSRKMISIGSDNTMYLNTAIVPRVKHLDSEGSARAFTMVHFMGGKIGKVVETWVSVIGEKVFNEEHMLFHADSEVSLEEPVAVS